MAETPRQIALDVLTDVETKACFADEVLNRYLSRAGALEKRDRNFLFELTKGTLRWRGRLDYFLDQISSRPLASVPVRIRNILRLAAYQILFLDRVPEWAAVDQAAQLARRYGHEGHVRFVNAVLRNLIRKRGDLSLPDTSQTVPYLAAAYSFPEWLIQRWVRRFGAGPAERLLEASNLHPPLFLRVNTLKISREEFIERITDDVEEARPHPLVSEGIEVAWQGDLTALPGYDQGWFYAQDPGSMLVARLTGAKPGERILDACAAPGGKASHLAQLMQDSGEIVALEIEETKIVRMQENLERLGIRCVKPSQGNAEAVEFSDPFDRVLVDAPCSGLGTIRRHPEAKWIKSEEDLIRHQERQLSILRNVSRFVRDGGTLIYATCSTESEENEEVIGRFLGERPEFTVDKKPEGLETAVLEMFDEQGYFHAYPHLHNTDGFFAARLIRKK
ncbi:MAG: 16S rRNA (cytosine(967)-C(5))-methyltransferase RsmB [bacterium]